MRWVPRLVGLELGLEVLLQGRNLKGAEAVAAGLANEVVGSGEEVAAAEAWLLSEAAHSIQPWDRADAQPLRHAEIALPIAAHRERELARMLGHEPAPLAILDCVELGLLQPMDGAIRSEMSVFAGLIQRPEPRNMIRTMFLGKQAWDKAERSGEIPDAVNDALSALTALVADAVAACPGLRKAGFANAEPGKAMQERLGPDFWFRSDPELTAAISRLGEAAARTIAEIGPEDLLKLDYACAREAVIPAYLGGASGLATLR